MRASSRLIIRLASLTDRYRTFPSPQMALRPDVPTLTLQKLEHFIAIITKASSLALINARIANLGCGSNLGGFLRIYVYIHIYAHAHNKIEQVQIIRDICTYVRVPRSSQKLVMCVYIYICIQCGLCACVYVLLA